MNSFRSHIRRSALLLMLSLATVLGLFLYSGLSVVLHRHVDAELLALAQAEVCWVERETGLFLKSGCPKDDDSDDKNLNEGIRSVMVLSHDGEPVWTGAAVLPRPRLVQTLFERVLRGEVVYDTIETDRTGGDTPVRRISIPVRHGGEVRYVLQAEAPLRMVQDSLQMVLWLLGAIGLLGVGAVWLGSDWLAREALTPVGTLSHAAEHITGPPLEAKVTLVAPYAEFNRLANAFNAMLARLEKVFEGQRRFVADAAHELKTPLTAMRGNLEVALRQARSAEEYRESMLTLLGEVERLIALAHSLLILAQLSGARAAMDVKPLSLEPILRDVVNDLDVLAKDRAIKLTLAVRPVPMVLGEAGRLKQVLINLLDNALRHTPTGGEIAVTLAATESMAKITVKDTGPGIAPEHLPHLFEPFFRADGARARGTGGTGLGLAIVKEIIEAHGGRVEVQSEVGNGALFTVSLPAKSLLPSRA